MKATVNVLCYKSKTLKNGEHPLMICLCKDNKKEVHQHWSVCTPSLLGLRQEQAKA